MLSKINYKLVAYISLLLLMCVCAFLIAKYIIRSDIPKNEIPIDTSTKL